MKFQKYWLLIIALFGIFTAQASPQDLKVMVLIPEQIIRRQVPDPAVETEMARVLIRQGFRVIDVAQAEKLKARDEAAIVLRGGSKQSLVDLGLKFGADVLITGEAFAEEVTPQPAEVTQAGFRAYQARIEIKGVDLSSGQLFISEAFTGIGIAVADMIAGKTALQRTAERAAPSIAAQLRNWEANPTLASRVFILKISGLSGFKQLNEIIDQIKKFANVQAVKNRQFDSSGAELEIRYSNTVENLAGELEDIGLKITNVNAGEIRAVIK